MSAAPQPIVIQVVRSTAPRSYEKYNGKAARVLGICQIVLAVASIVFSSASIGLEVETAYSGYGIVCGIFWIIAGSFGIASASRKTACTIITTMVLSILAAVGMGSYLSTAAAQIAYVEHNRYYRDYDFDSDVCGCFDEYDENTGSTVTICADCVAPEMEEEEYKARLAVSSLLVVVGVAELVVAIAAAVLCCRVACCCRRQTQVTHNGSGNRANQFLVVNTANGQQAVGLPAGYRIVTPAPGCDEKQSLQQPPQYTSGSPPPYTIDAKY